MTTENKETFMARLRPMLAPSELRKIELAYILTKDGHRSQTRKQLGLDGQPIRYFEHPRSVAIVVMDECKIYSPSFIITALGHDLLEDSEMTPELLEDCFGAEVTKWIKSRSKVPKEGYYERLKAYGSWQAMFIKLCDRLDNLRDMEGCDDGFKRKQCLETMQSIYPLAGELLVKCPDKDVQRTAEALAVKIRIRVEEIFQSLSAGS